MFWPNNYTIAAFRLKKRQLNKEENKTCQRFAGAVMEIWEKEEGKGYAKD